MSDIVKGECAAGFEDVCAEFEKNFSERGEVGAALSVYDRGNKVVDLWGGHKDMARTVPWERDTIVIMNSIAKSMCALSVHMLMDRGLVEFDAPVAKYWPDFRKNGKEQVLVRHVLSHSCGVIYADSAKPGDWADGDLYLRRLEDQEPAWRPGSWNAYNSVNIGFLLGEIVRRVTGKTVGTFIREEIAGKLGVDYHLGMKPDEIARVSDMHQNPANKFFKRSQDPSTPLGRAFKGAPGGYFQNDDFIRVGEVPSFGGHGTARAMAKIYSALSMDGSVDGVRLLSTAGTERTRWLSAERSCIMFGNFTRFGFGFLHNHPQVPMGDNPNAYGHTGSGGAFAWCDPDRQLSFAYVTNFQKEGVDAGVRAASTSLAAAACAARLKANNSPIES